MGLPIVTALFGIGIGIGIDYVLFIVTRYRQGLQEGMAPQQATVVAINTAGRSVIFAGMTVVISLMGMVLMNITSLTGNNNMAIVQGLSHTARVITAAAAIMITAFGSFAVGDQRVIKEFGFGLAVAVLIDASIVRLKITEGCFPAKRE